MKEELAKIRNKLKEQQVKQEWLLTKYVDSKKNMYLDLRKNFIAKQKEWWIKIYNDLTIRFTNENILFEPNSSKIRKSFIDILDEFIPKYIEIINNPKYNWQIKEIRIEGHAWKCENNQYLYCLELSQQRSNEIIKYIFNNNSFKKLDDTKKEKLKFLITSNGMSNWKNLDKYWTYIYNTNAEIDSSKSRRVEFKIITNSNNLVNKMINILIK
jgi:outer membrane protein OmpA-like peptidoglycan-associated protein